MNLLLISVNREVINMPCLPMGLGCVAAAVEKAGHTVTFLDLLSVEDIPAAVEGAIRSSQPKVIGVSVRNIDDQTMDPCRFLVDQAPLDCNYCPTASIEGRITRRRSPAAFSITHWLDNEYGGCGYFFRAISYPPGKR